MCIIVSTRLFKNAFYTMIAVYLADIYGTDICGSHVTPKLVPLKFSSII